VNLRSPNARLVWRGGRAVDCAGLENRKAERPREFESHPLRSHRRTNTTGDCITVSHNKLADFNAVQHCVAKSSFCIAHSLSSRNFKVCARPGRSFTKERAFFFFGQRGSGTVGLDYGTLKYNSAGQQQWVRRYDGPAHSDDIANTIAVDGLGNVYVTGSSLNAAFNQDYATIKYDSGGQQQWVRLYDGPGNNTDVANAIAVDASGNVYVTGSSNGSGFIGNLDYATIKYDPTGQPQWVARYDGPGTSDDVANAIAVDGLGNVYVTGSSYGSGTDRDYATIKYLQSATPTPTPPPHRPTPRPRPTPIPRPTPPR
jgi:hypothetical protein